MADLAAHVHREPVPQHPHPPGQHVQPHVPGYERTDHGQVTTDFPPRHHLTVGRRAARAEPAVMIDIAGYQWL